MRLASFELFAIQEKKKMIRRSAVLRIALPHVESLHGTQSTRRWSKSFPSSGANEPPPNVKRSSSFEQSGAASSFPVKSRLHHFDKGLDADALRFVAEAEEQYRISAEYALQRAPGGTAAPEKVVIEGDDGQQVEVRRIAAPFGETYVPSSKEAYAHRGKVGELSVLRDEKWMIPDERRDASRSFEAELRRLVLETGEPHRCEGKPEKCVRMMIIARERQLFLQPSTVEMVMQLWQQADEDQHSNALRYLVPMKDTYLYLRSTLASPTPMIIEIMMLMLSRTDIPNKSHASFAHLLLLDCDRYVCLPSRTTYAAYFDICNKNELMHFAVARYSDAIDKMHLEPDTGMVHGLLRGLNQNGLVEEAVAFLARVKEVQLDVDLLNSVLETLLMSSDPRACFSAFSAASSAPILPTAETFTLLLLACDRTADWRMIRTILSTMQRRRIQGTSTCLNLLLKGLLHERLDEYAHQLFRTMTCKGVKVWPALYDAMPDKVRQLADRQSQDTHQRKENHSSEAGRRTLVLNRGNVADSTQGAEVNAETGKTDLEHRAQNNHARSLRRNATQ